MKVFRFFPMMVFAVIIAACNSKENKTESTETADSVQTVTPVQRITGPLGKYFEAVPKDYKVVDGRVFIEVKRIKEGLPEPWKEGMGFDNGDPCDLDLSPVYCDIDGNVLRRDNSNWYLSVPEREELVALTVGDSMPIEFIVKEGERQIKLLSVFKIDGVSISSSNKEDDADSDDKDADSDDDSDEVASKSSKSSSSTDYDDLLDSYEKYVDKYIALMKKVKAGDTSAMSEYPEIMEEAQELGDKIQNATGELTASQVAKYQRITNKMMKAAQDL